MAKKKTNWGEIREQISRLLIKWGMGTRQAFILDVMQLWQEVPCCGHACCCNYDGNVENGIKVIREEASFMAKDKDKKSKKEKKKPKKPKY